MIAHLIDMGVPQKEIHAQLRQQLARARNIESKHPGLNNAIEEGRAVELSMTRTLMTIENVSKHFGEVEALRDISLEIFPER